MKCQKNYPTSHLSKQTILESTVSTFLKKGSKRLFFCVKERLFSVYFPIVYLFITKVCVQTRL